MGKNVCRQKGLVVHVGQEANELERERKSDPKKRNPRTAGAMSAQMPSLGTISLTGRNGKAKVKVAAEQP